MLFFSIAPLPYGYYTLLRLVACAIFAYSAYLTFVKQIYALPWIFSFIALLFNPIFKVYLPKEIWFFIDIGCALLLIFTTKYTTKSYD